MKKLVMIGAMCLLLCGCVQNSQTMNASEYEEYKTYYQTIMENAEFQTESSYFHVNTEMTNVSEQSYRYYIFIDEPQVAMYDCIAFVVENDIPFSDAKKMMPTAGILEEEINLIPNQVNKEDGYAKGIMLSGESDTAQLPIKMMVLWKNANGTKTYRQYLQLTMQYEVSDHEE